MLEDIKKFQLSYSQKDVRDILSKVKVQDYQICLKLIYACGLRIGEAVKIQIADIDGERKILTVRSGKGIRIELFQFRKEC